MSFDLAEVFQRMQPFAIAIVVALAIMAMAALSVSVERLWTYWRSRRKSREFGHKAAQLLERQNIEELIKVAKSYPASHLATLVASGLRTFVEAQKKPGELTPLELTRRELARKSEQVSADVRRGHSILASVGSVSPFVGLLGTVVGIIAAFSGIASEGAGNMAAISAGISEALVVTAIGLVVAIPSVLAFNLLSGRADALLLALDQSKGELLDYLENHAGASGHGREKSLREAA